MTRRKANTATVTPIREDAPAFPEELEAEQLPVVDLAAMNRGRATVGMSPLQPSDLPTPPVAKPRAPAQRRVSAEVVKAETKLLSLERRRQESLAHHELVWASKRADLILSFPVDVSASLIAMGVLVLDDPEPDE
jgi:hypothetical protein